MQKHSNSFLRSQIGVGFFAPGWHTKSTIEEMTIEKEKNVFLVIYSSQGLL